MKKLFLLATFMIANVQAAELKVMEFTMFPGSTVQSRFDIDLITGTAGVASTVTRTAPGPRGGASVTKIYERSVAELSLVNGELVLTSDGGQINCGTMGTTRIFKRPVLNLTGNCKISEERSGRKVSVSIVY